MDKEQWKQYIRSARRDYYKIGSIRCPAFGNELVHFNKYGFNHLIWKKREMRDVGQQAERIGLISSAVKIISNSTSYKQYRKYERFLNGTSILSTAHFWSFVGSIDSKRVTVVVRQTNNGLKHFFSVMKR